MSAREVGKPGAKGGYRFEILGDLEADAHDLFTRLRERIRQGLSVRHVQETEHGWQLTQPHRLRGVIEWDPETDGELPLLIVDGRPFTWDQVGRMLMAFEGFTLNAAVQDTIEVVVVEKIDLGHAGDLIAMCRRGGKRHEVRLSEVELTAPRPKGAEWVEAYRQWHRRR